MVDAIEVRAQLIQEIERLYPPDGTEKGAMLLAQARAVRWRKEPLEVLQRLRDLCVAQKER